MNIEARVLLPLPAPAPVANAQIISIPIPAKGHSPFEGMSPEIMHGPNEPCRVHTQSQGEKYFIMWNAIQQASGSLQQIKLDELEDRLRATVQRLEDEYFRIRQQEIEPLRKRIANQQRQIEQLQELVAAGEASYDE